MKLNSLPGTFFLSIALLSGPVPVTAQRAPTEEELAAINTTIAGVQAEIQRRNAERASVYSQLQAAEKTLSELTGKIAGIEADIHGSETRLSGLKEQRGGLQEKKSAQQALIAGYIRGAYQTGRQEYLKLLLSQEDPARTARILRYYRYFNDARSEKVAAYTATIGELKELEGEISASARQLKEQREALAGQRAAFETSQAQRRDLLDELDVVLSQSGKRLQALEAQRAEMELLLEELRRSIANLSLGDQQQPFSSLKGQLPWPVDGKLENAWGARYGLGDLHWQGVTIAAPAGTGVKAIHHGRVVYADWFSNSGLLLIIDHGNGYMSLYAHNQALYKEVGEWVTSGETIASVGNTGGQAQTGLYFEIRHNGEAENPSNWCLAGK